MLLFERQVVDVHSYPCSSDITSLSKERKAVTKGIRQRRSESRQSCSKRFSLFRQFIFLLRCRWKLKKDQNSRKCCSSYECVLLSLWKEKIIHEQMSCARIEKPSKANETFFFISISGQSKQFHLTYPFPDRFALERKSPQLRNAVEWHPRIVFLFCALHRHNKIWCGWISCEGPLEQCCRIKLI